MAQRMAACTFCHGEQGRAGPDGYYPRLAGKPEGYLYQQLLSFRDGWRSYRPMTLLLQHQSDAYLQEMARYFARQVVPYPTPTQAALTPAQTDRARQLITLGDAQQQIPACVSCHGTSLMGALPAIPGLLGLPRDYINAQLGTWRTSLRKSADPDCMGDIAKRLTESDVVVLGSWLSSQPVAAGTAPGMAGAKLPMACANMP